MSPSTSIHARVFCRYASGEHKITKATVAIFNAFKRIDVRCEATFPGQVRTYMVDGKGTM